MYSGYEVDDDWCVSVLQSYQAEGDAPFPWSVGELLTVQLPRSVSALLSPSSFASSRTLPRLCRRGHDSGGEAAAGTFLGKSEAHALKSGCESVHDSSPQPPPPPLAVR